MFIKLFWLWMTQSNNINVYVQMIWIDLDRFWLEFNLELNEIDCFDWPIEASSSQMNVAPEWKLISTVEQYKLWTEAQRIKCDCHILGIELSDTFWDFHLCGSPDWSGCFTVYVKQLFYCSMRFSHCQRVGQLDSWTVGQYVEQKQYIQHNLIISKVPLDDSLC